MFKFVNNDAKNPTGKRKQISRACETCRKRKKACHHNHNSKEVSAQEGTAGGPWQASEPSPDSELDASQNNRQSSSEATRVRDSPNASRAKPKTTNGRATPGISQVSDHITISPPGNSRFIGDLNPESIFLAATSPDATRDASSRVGVGVWLAKVLTDKDLHSTSGSTGLLKGSASLIPKSLVPILQEEALSTLPPPSHLTALSSMYFEKMYTILPIIDRSLIQKLPATDTRQILLKQAICLAASKSFISIEHLILPGSSTPISSREFGSRVSAAIQMIIELGLVTDKMVVIQALGAISFFVDGLESGSLASQHLSHAIQDVFSLGLHLDGHHRAGMDQYRVSLFCCMWVLDRMNAAFHGTPVMMHDRDIGRDLRQCFVSQEPVFRLMLEVTFLLDQVIGLYRPSFNPESSMIDFEFPSFEQLVSDCTSSHIGTSLLATIEIFYHAVAMLSYRSKAWDCPERSSKSFLRQSLASNRMSYITSQELYDQLVLFPFVPYAFSLSLSVAYRELRYNKLPTSRSRARVHFQNNCDRLFELGQAFGSASKMAKMGRSTLKEMDRVYSVVAVAEQRRLQPGNVSSMRTDENGAPILELNDFDRAPNDEQAAENQQSTMADQIQDFARQTPELDPSSLDSMLNVDLFSYFDPEFGLDSVDAQFYGTLDPSYSSIFNHFG